MGEPWASGDSGGGGLITRKVTSFNNRAINYPQHFASLSST